MGRERPGQRAAIKRLQNRGLDLDEPLGIEEPADRGNHPRADDEQLARLLVGDQIELPPPEPRLHVGQAMVLLGRRPQRLRQDRERHHPQRELAPPGHERHPVDPDKVPEIQAQQPVHSIGTELIDARLELDPPRAVDQIQEGHLALPAPRRQTSSDPVADRGLLTARQPRVGHAHGRDRLDPIELVGEWVDPGGAQRLELAPTRREQLIGGALGSIGAHGRRVGDWVGGALCNDVDLGDLEVPLALWRGDHDLVAALAAEQRLAHR